MNKPNCYISTGDSFRVYIRDSEEVIDLFGADYLEEAGHFVDEALLEEYKELYNKLKAVEDKLWKIKNEQDNERWSRGE